MGILAETFLPPGGKEEVSVAWLLEGIEERRVGRGEVEEREAGPPLRPRPGPVVAAPGGAGAAVAPAREVDPAPVAEVPPPPAVGASWGTRLFVLAACLAIVGSLVVAALYVGWQLPLILIAAVLLVVVVLAVLLVYEDKLKAETAGELMKAVLGKLGLLRRGSNRSQETDDSGS